MVCRIMWLSTMLRSLLPLSKLLHDQHVDVHLVIAQAGTRGMGSTTMLLPGLPRHGSQAARLW